MHQAAVNGGRILKDSGVRVQSPDGAGLLIDPAAGRFYKGLVDARFSCRAGVQGENSMKKGYRLQDDVHLPLPTAIWVLSAHFYGLVVPPLILIIAVYHHWEAVSANTVYPVLFFVAAAVMMAGSAFEIAQNAFDRWYLTAETGSAEGTGFSDFMFFWLIVASQGLLIIACQGDQAWIVLLCLLLMAAFPFLYFRQKISFLPLIVLGTGSVIAAYLSFGDPVIFLQLLLSQGTLYFFRCLLQTGAQVLHGFTPIAASSGILFLAWGIHGGSAGTPKTWVFVGVVAAAAILLAVLIRPALLHLPMTPRLQIPAP